MANLGTATVKVIPSASINIPRPGIKHSGATAANETSTELVPASGTLNRANIGDTVYNTTGTTIGIVTGLNYTGADITSLDTNVDFASGNTYEVYTSYVASLIPPAVIVGSLLEGVGTLTGSITSADSTDATNGVVTGATFTTSGSGTGGVINVTVSGNKVTIVTVTAIGSGYAVGDTLTVAVGVIGGSTALVITLDDEDITGDTADATQILANQGNGRLGIYSASAGAITGVDSNVNTFSYTAVAGATLPFFVSRINTIAGGMTALVGFVNND